MTGTVARTRREGAVRDTRTHYLAAFEEMARARPAAPPWLRELRRSAIDRFVEIGFPTTRDEDWRYTSLAPIVEGTFLPGDAPGAPAGLGPGLGAAEDLRLVLVNGRPDARLSSPRADERGPRLVGLDEALRRMPDLVQAHLGRQVGADGHGLAALNTAFVRDGALLHVPAGLRRSGPVYLVSVTRSPQGATLSQPRLLVVLEAGAEACLVESHVGVGDEAYWVNAVTEVVLGEGAQLEHVRLQHEGPRGLHVSRLQAQLSRSARFTTCVVSLGGSLVRQEMHVALDAEGAEAVVNGLYVLRDRQHVDTHTVIDHRRPHGRSRQLHKGVLDGQARAVFSGRVIVRPGAQKTDAHQANKNLLLSDGVEVDSRPQLEIFADDVKCTHGAADGQLGADALFYLRSRGLDEAMAKALLTYGFASEVLARIGMAPVRRQLAGMVSERLGVASSLLEETTE